MHNQCNIALQYAQYRVVETSMVKALRNRDITRRLRELVPLACYADFRAIEQIATRGHLRHLPASIAAWQAITTHIRHAHTDYDKLLEEGYDPQSARHFVLEAINEVLEMWGCEKVVGD